MENPQNYEITDIKCKEFEKCRITKFRILEIFYSRKFSIENCRHYKIVIL